MNNPNVQSDLSPKVDSTKGSSAAQQEISGNNNSLSGSNPKSENIVRISLILSIVAILFQGFFNLPLFGILLAIISLVMAYQIKDESRNDTRLKLGKLLSFIVLIYAVLLYAITMILH